MCVVCRGKPDFNWIVGTRAKICTEKWILDSFFQMGCCCRERIFVNVTIALWFGEKLQNEKTERQIKAPISSRDEFITTILHICSVFLTVLANKELLEKCVHFHWEKSDNVTICAKITSFSCEYDTTLRAASNRCSLGPDRLTETERAFSAVASVSRLHPLWLSHLCLSLSLDSNTRLVTSYLTLLVLI